MDNWIKSSLAVFVMQSCVLLFPVATCRADRVGYNQVRVLRKQNSELLIEHHHDWSHRTESQRYRMITTHQDPFRADNNYAFIKCTDKATGRPLFRMPTPALTYLWMSPDSKYIVGLSNIKLDNPYQLVVFDRAGKLLFKQHIALKEAALTSEQYREFQMRFP
jgi:hypothetical protein